MERYDGGEDHRDIFEDYNSSNIDNPRKTVIAAHNSISYQVDGMTDQDTIHSVKFQWNNVEVTMAEYFSKRFGMQLKDDS